MFKQILIIASMSVLSIQGAIAHGSDQAHSDADKPKQCHHESGKIGDQKARFIASKVVSQFVANDPGLGFGVLPISWKDLPESAAEINSKGDDFYVVGVNNEAEKKRLYVLISNAGQVKNASFDSDFSELKKLVP